LVTGSLWGRPTWGTYWVWDARLTSELVLLFLYFGVIALYNAFEEPRKAARAASLMAIVGAINLPIIHYSVIWWSSLHQGPTIKKLGNPSITGDMLWPLLLLVLAFSLFFAAILLYRVRAEVLEREGNSRWVEDLLAGGSG
jgi:heme exporter protein C